MIWIVISVVELVMLAIMATAFSAQEKKYDAALQDKNESVECEKRKTENQHEKYVEMVEKNWYLAQRNKSLVTILTIAKGQPDILHMEYMNEFLKEDDGDK